jgi:hypothetical protein
MNVRIQLQTLFLVASFGLSASAAIVTGHIETPGGQPLRGVIQFQPTSTVISDDGSLVGNGPVNVQLVLGDFSTNLIARTYSLTVPTIERALTLSVPPGTGSYDFLSLTTNVGVFRYITNGLGFISQRVLPGTNMVFTTNNAGRPNESLTISATASGSGGGPQQTNWPVSAITNAGTAAYSNANAFALAGSVAAQATHATNADTAIAGWPTQWPSSAITNATWLSGITEAQVTNALGATLWKNVSGSAGSVAASNVTSGGVLPAGTVSSTALTAGYALGNDGSVRIWTNSLNGVSIGGNAATVTTVTESQITNAIGATLWKNISGNAATATNVIAGAILTNGIIKALEINPQNRTMLQNGDGLIKLVLDNDTSPSWNFTGGLGVVSDGGFLATGAGVFTGSLIGNAATATRATYVLPATNGVTVTGTNVVIDMSTANAGSITLTTNAYIRATNSAPMRWYTLEVIQSSILTNIVTFDTNYTQPTVFGQTLTMPTNTANSRQFIYFQGRVTGNTNNIWQTLVP